MKLFRIVYILLLIAVIAVSVIKIIDAIKTKQDTGLLQITSSDPKATLAISKLDSTAVYAGVDESKVRLLPGTYLVSAEDSNQFAMKSVTITKQQQSSVSLNVNSLVSESKTNNALIAKLPQVGPASEYTIDYYLSFSNGQSTPVITISSVSSNAQQAALSWMSYYGFNPSQYKIIYSIQAAASSNANYFVGGN